MINSIIGSSNYDIINGVNITSINKINNISLLLSTPNTYNISDISDVSDGCLLSIGSSYVYANGILTGDIIYTDIGQTTPFDGDNSYWKLSNGSFDSSVQIANNGVVIGLSTLCS